MINGIINVYKEKGFTSHDVVAKLRGILRQKKIGHTGTLDPDAEGVLPVCLGNATKLCDMFTNKTKVYRCTMLLGVETDTEDISGNVVREAKEEAAALNEDKVIEAIVSFKGAYNQIPPMYSALKVNGQKLYELARQGIQIERQGRDITIYQLEIEDIRLPEVVFQVTCSKGTYIRSLCRDIGNKLGCGGCMKELLRMASGSFELENSLKLEQIQKYADMEGIEEYIVGTEEALGIYPAIRTLRDYDKLLHNGNPLKKRETELLKEMESVAPQEDVFVVEKSKITFYTEEENLYRVYDSQGVFAALYRYENGMYKNEKMFLN